MEIKLNRIEQTDKHTRGELTLFGSAILATLELPWRQNKTGVSCIPAGRYRIRFDFSPKFGAILPELYGVPGRSECKFHAANYPWELEGCVAPGMTWAGKGVRDSRKALGILIGYLWPAFAKGEEMWITVRDAEVVA